MEFNEKLNQYAELVVKTGVNLQNDQILVLQCPVIHAEFARLVSTNAYKVGAKDVVIVWNDEKSTRIQYDYASLEVFEEMPEWKKSLYNGYAEQGAAFVNIVGGNPEIFKGVSPDKLTAVVKASNAGMKIYRDKMTKNEIQWNIVAAPSEGWAMKVFPMSNNIDEAIDKLWESIFKAVRITGTDPVKEWQNHCKKLTEKYTYLNENQFKNLHFKSSIGTDFIVGLPENHVWIGGGVNSSNGVYFLPNMPTEEIFVAPHREQGDGKVVSSMPLSYQGTLIKDFSLTFKDGVVVDFDAQEGYESLERLLNTDEGAKRLGEVALVPYDSSISKMNTLFFNTLFDENASCHFALGRCYATNIIGGELLSKEDLEKLGGNYSITHVDFMIGTADLNVTATNKIGEEIVIFKDGVWAI